MMPIDLYCMALQDRSDRVRWLLEELGVPYKDHFLNRKNGDLQNPSYLQLNPMGRVPTIKDQEVVLFESAAICIYLADKYQTIQKLAPAIDNPERAEYLQWMIWSTASLEAVIARMFTHVRTADEKKATHEDVRFHSPFLAKALIPILSKQDYILKSGFSAADIMLAAVLPGAWDYIVEPYPEIKRYMERLMKRPAAIKVKVFEMPEH